MNQLNKEVYKMKKIILTSLIMLLAIGLTACNDISAQKEINSITKVSEASGDTEVATDNINYNKISEYMEEECKNAFSPYYELLDFEISSYQEEIVNGNVETTFLYKVIHKNYDKDPDTVGYIKEAKERGDKNYQQLYDEYLQPKEMNFYLKAIIDKNDLITLYSNISPHGTEWKEVKMTDFIIKKR